MITVKEEDNLYKSNCTVNELFSWYNGGPDWAHVETLNTMEVDSHHAQETQQREVAILQFLKEHSEEEIEVTSTLEDEGTWDIEFTLFLKDFSMQSLGFAFEDLEDSDANPVKFSTSFD